MTTLVCNKRGDQRFWDEVAVVEVNGVEDTIANHFKKATETDELIVDGHHYEKKYARSFYNMMWVKYLNLHPELVQEASKYRKYTGNSADVIRTYIKESKAAVMNDEQMVELLKQMRSNKPVNVMNDKVVIALTGHRPEKLDGYNIHTPFYMELARQLRTIVLDYVNNGKKVHMISGMALGADTIWALVGLKLKQQGYPVTLEAAIPCANHPSRWRNPDQIRWQHIVDCSDKVTQVSDKAYNAYLMQKRNEYMVDQCNVLVSVWDGTSGGTKNCLDYMSKKSHIEYINVNPIDVKTRLNAPLIHVKGDLIQSDCDIIMHQANCQSTMGSGIAKTIRAAYHAAYEADKNDSRTPKEKFGWYTTARVGNRTIVNLYGQFQYGLDKQHTNYKALENALRSFLQTVNGNPKIGLPYNMGCARAGGDWKVVEDMLYRVAQEMGKKLHIYKLN